MWLLILGLGLLKLPFAALMLWLPFRSDAALASPPPTAPAAEDEGEGGTKVAADAPGPWTGRHPRTPRGGRRPRRGPHGGAAGGPVPSPARVRAGRARAGTRVGARRLG
jgi:hypothetical protein